MIAFIVLLAMWPFHHHKRPCPDGVYASDCAERSVGINGLNMPPIDGPIIDINGAHYPGLADDVSIQWTLPEDESPKPCETSGELWFYTEDDGIIGFSSVSCAGAYYNWHNMHIDPVKTKLG